MRVRTAVAAGVLAAAASLSLAGVAGAEGGDCWDYGSQVHVRSGEHSYAAHRHDAVAVCKAHAGKYSGPGEPDHADGYVVDKGGEYGKYGEYRPEDKYSKSDDSRGDDSKGDDSRGDDSKGGDSRGDDSKGGDSRGDDSKGYGADGYGAEGDDDSGPAPVGGVETGAGGTAGDGSELLLPWSLAGGVLLAAGGGVLVRRRLTARPADRQAC